jgi:hypothetical protein
MKELKKVRWKRLEDDKPFWQNRRGLPFTHSCLFEKYLELLELDTQGGEGT